MEIFATLTFYGSLRDIAVKCFKENLKRTAWKIRLNYEEFEITIIQNGSILNLWPLNRWQRTTNVV